MIDRRLVGMTVAALGVMLAGCATRQPPAVATVASPVYAPGLTAPGGAAANLSIPLRRVDGSYPTPNESLSAAASIWHLRAALNVAALGCRGPFEQVLVSGYNQWIRSRAASLAAAERTLIAEYRGGGAAGEREAYDGAMTKLYNYFAQPPAHAGFCAAAAQVVSGIANVPASGLADFAARSVPLLDAPFVDFYRAYDVYREARDHPVTVPYARAGQSIAVMAATPTGKAPRIGIDPTVFKVP